MNRSAYDRALRAAAQLTFVSAIGGCGASSTQATAPSGGIQSPPSSGLASNASTPATNKPSSLTECRIALKASFPNGDPDWANWAIGGPPAKADRVRTNVDDASLIACCHTVASSKETSPGTGTQEFRDLGCCELTASEPNGSHCAPWGPPMPPSMMS